MEVKKVGKAGLALIKQFEGCRLEAYRCTAGRWRRPMPSCGTWHPHLLSRPAAE